MFVAGCGDTSTLVAVAAMKATTSYLISIRDAPEVMLLQPVLDPLLVVLQGCLVRGEEENVTEGLDIIQHCVALEQPLINEHIAVLCLIYLDLL